MRAKPSTRNSRNVKNNNNSNSCNSSGKFSIKKPLKENVSTSNKPDNSVLRPPIDTSIAGLKQAVKLFDTGTPEVVHLLTFECDVIYECRVCRNLFRSIANFISHKRVYCTLRFNHVQTSPVVEDHTILVEEKLGDNCLTLPSRITARQDLTSIMQTSTAQYYKEVEDKLSSRDNNRCDSTIHLQPIESTTYGVYQTVGKKDSDKLIKNQVSELNKIISSNEEVVLGPDGKIVREGEEKAADEHIIVDELICPLCKIKFSSKKTLSHHTKTVHESFRVCYSCPCCKNLFSNTWSVHRHLYKVHRKTNEQVRRLRSQIQKKQVRAEKLTEKFNRKSDNKSKKEDNKAWMEHFEDDLELQRCGGCGRRFERRAALTAHAQICHKRIAACNTVQSVKRKEEKVNETHSDVVVSSVKQQSAQGSPMQKVQSEKKIGIQVRMNYCKNAVGNAGIETRRSERHKILEDKEDSLVETLSFDSILKDRLLSHSVESVNNVKFDSSQDGEEKPISCNSHIDGASHSSNSNNKTHYLRKNSSGDSRVKSKRLENMCLQLRKAVEIVPENNLNSEKSHILNSSDFERVDSGNNNTEEVVCKKIKESNKSKSKQIDIIENFAKTEDLVTNVSSMDNCEASSSKEINNAGMKSDFSVLSSEGSIEEFNSNVKNDSNFNTTSLSCSENVIIENQLFENSERTSAASEKNHFGNEFYILTEKERKLSIEGIDTHSFLETIEKEGTKDSVGILTRYKVRSIFKGDNSSFENMTNNEIPDQEELSMTDESSLKENLNETLSDDQPNWMQKKMSQYFRYKNKQCLICLKKFKLLLHIKQHVADHLGWNNYHCLFSNCSYVTFSKSDCIKHLMKTHLKPNEKHRASGLVGELGQVKSDNCDIDVKNLSKRKNSETDTFCLQQTVLNESIESEFKMLDKDSVTVVSINDDSNEIIIAEECVHTSKVDSSLEQSEVEQKIKKKIKRRKVIDFEKHNPNPPVRKCSPDSTTELTEKDLKTDGIGAQFRDDFELPEAVCISGSGEVATSFSKLNSRSEQAAIYDIPDNKSHVIDHNVSVESVDSDIHGKGRDTEEEDESQNISVESNMDDGNLRRMVMEVIFGNQVSTRTEKTQSPE